MSTAEAVIELKHRVTSKEEWVEASKALLAREKAWTREKDAISAQRRELPWVKVEKSYEFDSHNGKVTLVDLFGSNRQLIVYHFMFAPDWDEGCPGCSFISDHVDGARQHFEHHDVSYVAVSRAPLTKLDAYKKRMGWTFKWVSSGEGDFNYDYHASYKRGELDSGSVFHNFTMQNLRGEDQPGLSVFYKDESGNIYHTYSSYERGGDIFIGAYNFLDITPKGRNEAEIMDWMQRHDRYEAKPGGKPVADLQPRMEMGKPLFIAGVDQAYTFENMSQIPQQWHRFGPQIGKIPGQVGEVAYGVCHSMTEDGLRYLTGVEVSEPAKLPESYGGLLLPAQKYAVFTHEGHVSKIGDTHEAIQAWMPISGMACTDAPTFFERYGEKYNPATGMGDIEIWVPVKA